MTRAAIDPRDPLRGFRMMPPEQSFGGSLGGRQSFPLGIAIAARLSREAAIAGDAVETALRAGTAHKYSGL